MVDRLRIDRPDLLKQPVGDHEPSTPTSTIAQVGRLAERSSMRNKIPSRKQREIAGNGILDTHARVLIARKSFLSLESASAYQRQR